MIRVLVLFVALVASSYADAKRMSHIDARIIRVEIRGADQVFTADKGADHGITKDWSARLVIKGKPSTSAKMTIVRVEKTRTIASTSVTFDQIPGNMSLRFLPPDSALPPSKPAP